MVENRQAETLPTGSGGSQQPASHAHVIPYSVDSLDIDNEKKEAIRITEGPLLIIAGPGSGKTKTLVERVVHLVTKGVSPTNILVATFTEKAAAELVTRISNRLLELKLKVNLNEMYVGTLHSIFLRIVDDHREFTRLKRNFRVLDQFDQRYLIFRKNAGIGKSSRRRRSAST